MTFDGLRAVMGFWPHAYNPIFPDYSCQSTSFCWLVSACRGKISRHSVWLLACLEHNPPTGFTRGLIIYCLEYAPLNWRFLLCGLSLDRRCYLLSFSSRLSRCLYLPCGRYCIRDTRDGLAEINGHIVILWHCHDVPSACPTLIKSCTHVLQQNVGRRRFQQLKPSVALLLQWANFFISRTACGLCLVFLNVSMVFGPKSLSKLLPSVTYRLVCSSVWKKTNCAKSMEDRHVEHSGLTEPLSWFQRADYFLHASALSLSSLRGSTSYSF